MANTFIKVAAMFIRYAIVIALAYIVYNLKNENRELKAKIQALESAAAVQS